MWAEINVNCVWIVTDLHVALYSHFEVVLFEIFLNLFCNSVETRNTDRGDHMWLRFLLELETLVYSYSMNLNYSNFRLSHLKQVFRHNCTRAEVDVNAFADVWSKLN